MQTINSVDIRLRGYAILTSWLASLPAPAATVLFDVIDDVVVTVRRQPVHARANRSSSPVATAGAEIRFRVDALNLTCSGRWRAAMSRSV